MGELERDQEVHVRAVGAGRVLSQRDGLVTVRLDDPPRARTFPFDQVFPVNPSPSQEAGPCRTAT